MKAIHEIRNDLFCPVCANSGMRHTSIAESGRKRYRCTKCRARTTKPLYAAPQLLPKFKRNSLKGNKFFVITSAVNDTPIIKDAHEIFKKIAKINGGKYIVIPGVYKNPDLTHQGIINSYTWPHEILPYICDANVNLNKSILIRGKTRINYTSVNPLGGLNHAGSTESEVYGHPQVSMQMIATPRNDLPKMLHTTGTISAANYSGSVAGQKAEHHHSISALIIEIEGNKFWPREIHFDGEGVYDLNKYYTVKKVKKSKSVAGIVYGDIHVKFLEKVIDDKFKQVRKLLNPAKEVYHDLHDNDTGSHHNMTNMIFNIGLSLRNEMSLRDELMMSAEYMADKLGAYIIDSNHHRHLDQWFNRFNPQLDPINAPLFFELGEMVVEDLKNGGDANLFKLFMQKYCPAKLNFPNCDDTFYIANVDCSQHGDRGPNGARGSAKSFAKSGHRTMIGHGHSPGIEKGCYQVGVATMKLAYAKGLSSWCNTHGIIYPNGKRALFHIVKYKLSPSMRSAINES